MSDKLTICQVEYPGGVICHQAGGTDNVVMYWGISTDFLVDDKYAEEICMWLDACTVPLRSKKIMFLLSTQTNTFISLRQYWLVESIR